MSKIIIEFNLPEEREEYKLAVNASKYFDALWDADHKLREWLKHGHQFKTIEEALQAVRDSISEGVDLYE